MAAEAYPDADYSFLDQTVFSIALSLEQQKWYTQLLKFVWNLQLESPIYEPLYFQLLHLYVLNGSRLDLLKCIDRALRGLAAGQASILLISGMSGIGKTSLVMAFQERVSQLEAVFTPVYCSERERTPFALWQKVVREVAAVTGQPMDQVSAPAGSGPPAPSTHQFSHSLSEWLANSASVKPLVIFLDDIHWADEESLEVLETVTRQSLNIPILFIASYRSEEVNSQGAFLDFLPQIQHDRQHEHLYLHALTQDDIQRLVTVYHGPCSEQLASYLIARAEGHPLFTMELLNDLIEQNLLLPRSDGAWLPPALSSPIPELLKHLITQRVSRLGKTAEQLLQAASVIGESWELKIAEQVASLPEEEMLDALENALRSGIILVEDEKAERYRFSHGLFREVLYAQQLGRRRKRIHEKVALLLEQEEHLQVNRIAHHFYEAEHWKKAVEFSLEAGNQSIQSFAYRSALGWYHQALEAAQNAGSTIKPIELRDLYERLGRTHMALEQREQAEIAYSRMQVIAHRSEDQVSEGLALISLADVRMRLYQIDLSQQTASEALKIAERSGDPALLARVHSFLRNLLILRGELDQAADHAITIQQNIEAQDDSIVMGEFYRFSAYQAIWAGSYFEAEAYALQALRVAQKIGDPVVTEGAYQNLSFSHIEMGRYVEAHREITSMLEAGEASGSQYHQLPRLLNLMGYLYLELGDARQALHWDQKALEASRSSRALSNYEMQRYSLLNIATDYLHLGRPAAALEAIAQFEAIKEAIDFARFRYYNRYQLLMVEVHLAQQEYDQAVEQAKEARTLAQSKGMRKNIAKSYWYEGQALAGTRQLDAALRSFDIAIATADEIQHASLRWRIRLSMAETLQKAGKSTTVLVQKVHALVDQVAISLEGSPLQDIFLASFERKRLEGFERGSAPEKRTYPAGLTEREVEVLRFVASGATNQQVAEVLHISVRTVNTHMTNILNKTGCENRTAASAFAIQNNLVTT